MYNELLLRRLKISSGTYGLFYNRLVFLKQHTLKHRRVVLSKCTFYDIYHKFSCCNILNSFACHNSSHVLRGYPHKLFIPFCKTNMQKKIFIFKIIYLWNSLPYNVINTNITNAFANHLYKPYLFNYANFSHFIQF